MAFVGMDPVVVRQVGGRLMTQSSELSLIVAAIDRLMADAGRAWDGRDFHSFESAWRGTYRAALRRAADDIEGLARAALNNASDQERVSLGASSGPGISGLEASALTVAGLGAAEFGTQFATLARHSKSIASVPWRDVSLAKVGGMLKRGNDVLGKAGPLAKYAKFVRPLDVGLAGAGLGLSSSALAADLKSGDEGKAWRDGMDTAVGMAGLVPVLALPAAAFSTGELIGDGIVQIPAVKQQINAWDDVAFDHAMLNSGGDAHAVAERYSGLAGPLHFAQDSVAAGWEKIAGIF